MNKMSEPIKEIRDYLDELEESRDKLLDMSHKTIRKCSRAIASLHRGEKENVLEKINEISEDISDLNSILDSDPQFEDHGSLIAANREFAELFLTNRIMDGRDLPKPSEIGVLKKGYAQALAETVGELRRYFLNLLRRDDIDEAQRIHDRMEQIFGLLEEFDYPDSILPGMKHRRDVARKSLEKTRADITRATREKKLEEALSKTERRLGDLDEI